MAIVVPFLRDEVLRARAEAFLQQYHPSRAIPVPIEEIIEFEFGMDIITMPGFSQNYEVDAFISTCLTEIRVDESVARAKNKNRYRFSLAHELSHKILHAPIFSALKYNTVADWKNSRDAIPEKEYGWLEYQANAFAGLILVPPAELAEKFEVAKRHAESVGISIHDATAETWDSIERFLAAEFSVSQGVIARRAPRDGLWEV